MVRRLTTHGMLGLCSALAVALGFGALSAPVSAQVPTNGVIYACVRLDRDQDEGKLVRLVAANEKLPAQRNQGPVERRRSDGPTGPTGPQGPPDRVRRRHGRNWPAAGTDWTGWTEGRQGRHRHRTAIPERRALRGRTGRRTRRDRSGLQGPADAPAGGISGAPPRVRADANERRRLPRARARAAPSACSPAPTVTFQIDN